MRNIQAQSALSELWSLPCVPTWVPAQLRDENNDSATDKGTTERNTSFSCHAEPPSGLLSADFPLCSRRRAATDASAGRRFAGINT